MSQACGSIHYVAPEVLAHAYTEKADMWSIGVIVYMLLTGSPPFHGSDDEVLKKIKAGSVHWSSRFNRLSTPAKSFLQALLVLDPAKRLSAQEALEHPWIQGRHQAEAALLDAGTLESLRTFSRASQFRRNVLSMMAWSLSTEDRLELRKQFLSLDRDMGGTISLKEFKDVLAKRFDIGSNEAEQLFKSLDTDNNDEIEYSEFLAAALLGHVKVHEDVLRKTFSRFDADGDGKIDCEELRCVLGDTFSKDEIEEVLREADTSGDGKIDYEEFLAYFHKPEPEQARRSKQRKHTEKLGLVIDSLMASEASHPPPCATEPAPKDRQTAAAPPPPSSTEPARKGKDARKKVFRTRTDPGRPLPMLLNNLRVGFRSKQH